MLARYRQRLLGLLSRVVALRRQAANAAAGAAAASHSAAISAAAAERAALHTRTHEAAQRVAGLEQERDGLQ